MIWQKDNTNPTVPLFRAIVRELLLKRN